VISDASPARSRWEEATREVASLLDDRTCVVMIGERDDDAARVALALARAHARRRPVTIVDAVGELAPLQTVLPRDAGPHGVIDHFESGVSLRKIAKAVNREGTLFVVPSGAGPFEYGMLLRRERWRRLIMAFRNEGALLLIILPASAEGLVQFIEDTDGVVLVGDLDYPEPRHIVARVASRGQTTGDLGPRPSKAAAASATDDDTTRKVRVQRAAMVIAAALVIVAASALWIGRGDGTTTESERASAITSPASAGSVILDDVDTTGGAFYAVDVVMLSSLADAGRQLSERLGGVPAATFSPMVLGTDSARWYRVLAGAWPGEREADSALAALRAAGVIPMGYGSVRRTPFAVRIADSLPQTVAIARATELRAQGFPAYALARDAAHATVYAGAFETPSQATPLLDMFKQSGIAASVAYRIGRGL
jgi:hypothetical protein